MTVLGATRVGTWMAFATALIAARRWPRATERATALVAGTLGMAHGAADDMLLASTFARPALSQRRIGVAYALAAGATFAAARSAPRSARVALLALTWFHFGSGDAAFAAACANDRRHRTGWIVRGALPLGSAAPALRAAAALGAALTAASALLERRWGDAIDVALPALAFGAIPERQTFLSYFALWHSPRHVALIVERYAIAASRSARAGAFVRAALVNTLVALGTGSAIIRLTKNVRTHVQRDVVDALILSITVPHLVAVNRLEDASRKRRSLFPAEVGACDDEGPNR